MARDSKAALTALARRVGQSTKERGEVVKAKRVRAKTEREKNADKFAERLNSGQTPKEVLNWKTVRKWFHEEIARIFGDKHHLPPESDWWTGKEISLAKRLVQLYSGDLLHEGIVHLCESWEAMVEDSKGKLDGIPTIGFLWSTKERIVGAIENREKPKEKTRKRHHRGEYDPATDDMPGVGW